MQDDENVIPSRIAMEIAKDLYAWYDVLNIVNQRIEDGCSVDDIKGLLHLLDNDVTRVSNLFFDLLGPIE